MICILKIGYTKYVLPSEKGLSTILTALSKAREVKDDRRYRDEGILLGDRPTVSSEMLPNYRLGYRPDRDAEPLVEAELLPPERPALSGSARRALPAGRRCIEGGH